MGAVLRGRFFGSDSGDGLKLFSDIEPLSGKETK